MEAGGCRRCAAGQLLHTPVLCQTPNNQLTLFCDFCFVWDQKHLKSQTGTDKDTDRYNCCTPQCSDRRQTTNLLLFLLLLFMQNTMSIFTPKMFDCFSAEPQISFRLFTNYVYLLFCTTTMSRYLHDIQNSPLVTHFGKTLNKG